jgi:hypothetical protein
MNSFFEAIGFSDFWRRLYNEPTNQQITDIKQSIFDNIIKNDNASILSSIYEEEERGGDIYYPVDVINHQPMIVEDEEYEDDVILSDYGDDDQEYMIPIIDIPSSSSSSSSSSSHHHPTRHSHQTTIMDKKDLQNKLLINSPRNRYVEFDKNRKKFLIKILTMGGMTQTVTASGIHSIIQKFQPISISELCQINNKRTHDKSKNASVNTIKRVNTEWAEIIRSRNQVDLCSEIEDCPNCTKIDNKKHGSIVDSEIQMFTLPPINYDISNMFQYVEGVDSCTIRLLLELNKRNWSIVSPQHKIFDEELKIATAVDIICRDNTNNDLIIIELKTSKHTSDDYYTFSHPDYYYDMMRAPRSFPETGGQIPLSMKNDDLLQILITHVIIKERYGIVPDISLLIRLGGDKIWIYELEDWCYEIMPVLRRNILLHQQNLRSMKDITKLSRKRK